MKKYLLWVAAAFAAEIVIMVIGTVAGLDGTSFLIAVLILPVGLFAAALYFLFFRPSGGNPPETREKGENAKK